MLPEPSKQEATIGKPDEEEKQQQMIEGWLERAEPNDDEKQDVLCKSAAHGRVRSKCASKMERSFRRLDAFSAPLPVACDDGSCYG